VVEGASLIRWLTGDAYRLMLYCAVWDRPTMDLDEAITHAKRGDSVLFTGAGFSYGAANILPDLESAVPTAKAFAARLAAILNTKGVYDLPVISQFFVKKRGEHGLVDELIKNFSITSFSEHHEQISAIPWRRVYTTNYDNCFEISALKSSGKAWTPLTLDAGPSAAPRRCIHINGHVNNLDVRNLASQVKLTHSSYASGVFSESQWAQQFRQDLNGAKSIIYVGYSMSDIDISRLLFLSPELRRKTVFIVGPDEDEVITSPLEDYGEVYAIGIEAFARAVASTPAPSSPSAHEYSWLTRYSPPEAPARPDDKASIELLTMGVAESQHVAWSLASEAVAFCVVRDALGEILSEVDGGRRWFLIHSDLGNGKSILKQQLSELLCVRGFDVFWDTDFELNRDSDISQLSRIDGKVAVFIDEASDRFAVIDGLLRLNNPNIAVFVCVRSTLYELGEAKYDEYLPKDFIPIDVNRLTDRDADRFAALLSTLGLWGTRASDSDWAKANFIKVECGRQIARLIISSFEESEVGRRISKAAFDVVNKRSDVSALIILSFILNRIGHPPRPTLMSEILNKDVWATVKSEEFKSAGEFIAFRNGVVTSRSSIIGTYLLRKALTPENLVWHLDQYVRRLSRIRRDSTLHHVFTELQRFPMLEGIIESGRKREIIIGYYQSIKDIPACERSALFWLHYAMARLSYGEFKESGLYFEHARSLARGNPKDLMEVNNHYARLLLDSRTKSDEYGDLFEAFEAAHDILIAQMNRGSNKHFPYRQAKKYVEFVAFRKKDLTQSQLDRFVLSCKQVVSAIHHLDGTISRSTEVQECEVAMARAIRIAQGTESEQGTNSGGDRKS
jgi:SIR2-like domain